MCRAGAQHRRASITPGAATIATMNEAVIHNSEQARFTGDDGKQELDPRKYSFELQIERRFLQQTYILPA